MVLSLIAMDACIIYNIVGSDIEYMLCHFSNVRIRSQGYFVNQGFIIGWLASNMLVLKYSSGILMV